MSSNKYYTPQIRFATPDQAAMKSMVQTVESTVATPSDHASKKEHFSGVLRYRRDFRKYLATNLFPPSITDAIPPVISTNQNRTVTLVGSNFQDGTRVWLNGVEVAAVTFVDENNLIITVLGGNAGALEGPIDIYLVRPDTISYHNLTALRYEDPPSISSIAPVTGWMEGGDLIVFSGSHFKQGSSVNFGFSPYGSVTSSNVTWLSNQELDVFSPTPPAAAVSATNFTTGLSAPATVFSPSGMYSSEEVFYFTFHAPTGSALSQYTGSTEGGDPVTITGRWFNPGMTVTMGTSSGVPATLISRETATFLTVDHPSGTVAVTLQNVDGSSSLPIYFQYTGLSIPRIVSVTSTFSTPFGTNVVKSGTQVSVSGNNYTSTLDPLVLATSVTVGGALAAFTIVDRRHLYVTMPALGTMGFYDVKVSGAYGDATLSNAVRYLVAPVVTDINPKSGTVLGGATISVTASNMLTSPEMTVTMGGVTITSWQVVASNVITFTVPSHVAGTGQIVLNLMGLVSGVSSNYTWFTASGLAGPFYPNPVG